MKKKNYIFFKYKFSNKHHKFKYYLYGLIGNFGFIMFSIPFILAVFYIIDSLISKHIKDFNVYVGLPIVCITYLFIQNTAFLFSKDKGVYLYDDGTILIKNRCFYNSGFYKTNTKYKLDVRDIIFASVLNDNEKRHRYSQMPLTKNTEYVFICDELKGYFAFILEDNEAFVNELLKRNNKIKTTANTEDD